MFKRCLWLLALFVAALVVPACETVQGSGKVDGGWPWRPTSLSVHELTRISRPDAEGRRFVEVRVEFLDRDLDPTKAYGRLSVAIKRLGEEEPPWTIEVDLERPDVSRERYESVTATYLLRLQPDLPGLVPGRRIQVKVRYEGVDGARFSDSRELAWPE
ncbi:MAG: hypothetical protein MK085_01905 [Phycisphaerales bacterium]|nr:hypothetical protein [Phycisphaerales bacterium]